MSVKKFAKQRQTTIRFSVAVLVLSLFNVACSNGGTRAIDLDGQNTTGDESEATLTAEQLLHRSTEEMELTWQAALVRVPSSDGSVIDTTVNELASGEVVPDQTYPVVIYLHGCNGFWSGTYFRINWLAQNGFVVIAPLSFARSFYPQSCDPSTNTGGFYRSTGIMRQYDAGYAINKVREFAWADKDNLILAGFSEGGIATANYANSENPEGYLKARIIEGWPCKTGWLEYQGIKAPASQAVLALVADEDPWYRPSYHQGDCGEFMNSNNGSLSFVVDYEPLRFEHALWGQAEIQEIVRTFLQEQLIRIK
ncbi:MAG: hypothetical protein V3U65_14930 [Granulosicoccaceae bacterium]